MLCIVPTPIGNKDDITLRALKLLTETSIIFCENTQSIKRLLGIHNIDYSTKRFLKFTSHDLHHKENFIHIMKESDVCMVSEAWTPGLSDPWKLLILWAQENNIPYSILPWANAIIPAVIGSWFPTVKRFFYGFLPHKKWRETALKQMIHADYASFFYESVHRIDKLLSQLTTLWFSGKLSITREISKVFEQYYTGTLEEIQGAINQNIIPLKGEFVIGIYPHGWGAFIDSDNDDA